MLSVDMAGPVGIIRLQRPERRNALSMALMEGIVTVLDGLESGDALAAVITGDGGVFCAGADFNDLREHGSGLEEALEELSLRLLQSPIPIIAAVNGPCVGGGVELAMSCDIRVCDEAAYFEIPATKLGVLYRPEGLDLLASRLPHQTVSRLFHVNERIPASEAVSAGIVARVAPRGEAVQAALGMLDHQQDLQPEVVAATKRRLREIERRAVDLDGWNDERARFMDELRG